MTHVSKRFVLSLARLFLTSAVVLFLVLASASSSVLAQPAAPAAAVSPSAPDLSTNATCTNLVKDPGFEAGSPNLDWNKGSNNGFAPPCAFGACPGAGQAGPRTGSNWAWFGGVAASKDAFVSQSLVIPPGTATLQFYLWIGTAAEGSDYNDVFAAFIDESLVFYTDATQASNYSTYKEVIVDATNFADGTAHAIMFVSSTTNQLVNFNLDDVALCSPGIHQNIYLPAVRRNLMSHLTIINQTSGTLCTEVYDSGIGRLCFDPGEWNYGYIKPGTYTIYTTVNCGSKERIIYLAEGEMYYRVWCTEASSGRPGVEMPSTLQEYLSPR